jgi:hypothetical protein
VHRFSFVFRVQRTLRIIFGTKKIQEKKNDHRFITVFAPGSVKKTVKKGEFRTFEKFVPSL